MCFPWRIPGSVARRVTIADIAAGRAAHHLIVRHSTAAATARDLTGVAC
jgi:hypothetical protein